MPYISPGMTERRSHGSHSNIAEICELNSELVHLRQLLCTFVTALSFFTVPRLMTDVPTVRIKTNTPGSLIWACRARCFTQVGSISSECCYCHCQSCSIGAQIQFCTLVRNSFSKNVSIAKIYASRSRCDQGGMVRRVGGALDNICYSEFLRRIFGTVCVKASIFI